MTDPEAPRALAVVRTYDDLHAALRARSAEREMTRAELDRRAGFTDGHAGKILAPRKTKRLGQTSWPLMLGALGLVLIIAEEGEAVERIEKTIAERRHASDDASAPTPHWRNGKGRAWGRRLAALRAIKLPPKRRREIAKRAAAARWGAGTANGQPGDE
jgi:hypothetical protein